jgi:hypothetical protein
VERRSGRSSFIFCSLGSRVICLILNQKLDQIQERKLTTSLSNSVEIDGRFFFVQGRMKKMARHKEKTATQAAAVK